MWLRYVRHSLWMAFHKCFSKLGLSIEIPLWIVGFVAWLIVARPTWIEIFEGEYMIFLIIFLGFFVLVFLNFFVWELQVIFPTRITVNKINGIEDVSIVIKNSEVVDFEEMSIELEKTVQLYSFGDKVELPIPPNDRSFDLEGDRIIGYESQRAVKIASKKDERFTLCLQTPLTLTGWESSHNGERSNAVIRIDLIIKGKINSRPIYPKRLSGQIDYWHQPVDFVFTTRDGKSERQSILTSSLEWNNLL